ncbi:MAG: hypothetical protein DMG05_26110 [Acidobacteria bacterium]|nr:MAG: hypothetical protein DMG05_26110 [Acidobacteriota bacterium]
MKNYTEESRKYYKEIVGFWEAVGFFPRLAFPAMPSKRKLSGYGTANPRSGHLESRIYSSPSSNPSSFGYLSPVLSLAQDVQPSPLPANESRWVCVYD